MLLTHQDIIAKIEAHLSDQHSITALAKWALARFYAIEQGVDTVNEDDSETIADVLDALMFADEQPFALDDADLRRLIARLEPL
ncbi:hypothetical protein [Candidatus Oscillochloris fontis]|uniref:hypothetical protein n=1 Tax=Candidatus Oscillochloris fontis TaxID=2496868 RepID=UPI001EE9612D|nr:hypothetical protein [Candidatus Oscillochloris fontis]